MEQTLTLTEREVNLIRNSLEQEHDRLAKELSDATNRPIIAAGRGFLKEASALASHRESLVRRIRQISELLKKL